MTLIKTLVTLVTSVAALTALTALTAAAPALADITVGISLPLTGPASGLGIPMQNWPIEPAQPVLRVCPSLLSCVKRSALRMIYRPVGRIINRLFV